MGSSLRLRVTCVRPADAHDTGLDAAAVGEWLLVVGQPSLGHVRLTQDADATWWLTDLEVAQPDPHKLIRMLLQAAFGVVLDAGGAVLRTGLPHPDLVGFGFIPAPEGGWVRKLIDEPRPVPAVSVIPLRQTRSGLEVFVQHRVATMDFVPGAVVFPGGRVDATDTDLGSDLRLPPGFADAHAASWANTGYAGETDSPQIAARTLLATGVREVAEETGAQLQASRLVPWDNWVTPIDWPRRFDVSFFVVADEGDPFAHTTTEAHLSEWVAVDDLVAQVEGGVVAMVPPTRTIVDELQALASVDAVLGLNPVIRAVRHDVTRRRPRPGL